MTMTVEEGTEYTVLYNDIETLVQEATLRIFTGTDSIESWDSIVGQVQAMNIDRAIAIQQTALDRYNAR